VGREVRWKQSLLIMALGIIRTTEKKKVPCLGKIPLLDGKIDFWQESQMNDYS